MTWRKLIQYLMENNVNLDDSIEVYENRSHEHFPVKDFGISSEEGILSKGSCYIVIDIFSENKIT